MLARTDVRRGKGARPGWAASGPGVRAEPRALLSRKLHCVLPLLLPRASHSPGGPCSACCRATGVWPLPRGAGPALTAQVGSASWRAGDTGEQSSSGSRAWGTAPPRAPPGLEMRGKEAGGAAGPREGAGSPDLAQAAVSPPAPLGPWRCPTPTSAAPTAAAPASSQPRGRGGPSSLPLTPGTLPGGH